MEKIEQKAFEFLTSTGTGKCLITLLTHNLPNENTFIVVMSQLPSSEYTGMSVTNAVENIARQYFVLLSTKYYAEPKNVAWIEHYPEDGWGEETFDGVTFDEGFENPKWERLAPECQYMRYLIKEMKGE